MIKNSVNNYFDVSISSRKVNPHILKLVDPDTLDTISLAGSSRQANRFPNISSVFPSFVIVFPGSLPNTIIYTYDTPLEHLVNKNCCISGNFLEVPQWGVKCCHSQ